ncbi:lipoprotein [Lacrimispora xylanolytica]|jgi:D-methionine transport system substrate-binding protein|uniref:Lipoprotein n=1 Tax=Lacrimispora xylanolytica TaxID=29375 RepID=A0ABY7AH22_9FIRM|nr:MULTISPECIES: MetQ/NlpA family ABC transporter substrate-binding protein [Clostridia]MBS5957449.1 MetQ/NlpA family ABC transporter substrate-binding protein [Clostridiales bacterium]WAJ25669.1 MetQ/NlpA family ABC transporter substrate-binding protein [Lacrimispora xylanolytica]
MKKSFYVLTAAVLLAGALTACSSGKGSTATTAAESKTEAASSETTKAGDETKAAGDLEKIVVGATPAPHAEILNAAKDILKEKGYELVVKEYTDYVQPNLALDSGDLDANYFQHQPYLDQFNEQNKTNLVSAAAIHYEPFGIYAGKTKSLEELKEGAQIAVPNDVSNEARALLLLADNGLIELKEGVELEATKNDIVKNEKNFKIIEVEAAQLPRSLGDVDVAVINGNYAIEAGLKVSEALAVEDAKSVAATRYSNIVAVRSGDESNEKTKALVEALTSEEVKKFINDKYDGAVVPSF